MPDLLIRNVDEETVRQIDARAAVLGLSRSEFLRREVHRIAGVRTIRISWEDIERAAEIFADAFDDEVMERAWR